MEVWVPPGELVGEIVQEFCLNGSRFGIYNRHLQIIYRIEGPTFLACCTSYSKDKYFRVGKLYNIKMFKIKLIFLKKYFIEFYATFS